MKKIILAIAVAALASIAVTAFASADVARYSVNSFTITAVQPKDAYHQFADNWTHTFTVTTANPCDGSAASSSSFAGNGSVSGTPSAGDSHGFLSNETITGTLNADGTISFTAVRALDGYTTTVTNAKTDGSTVTLAASDSALEFKVSVTPSTSAYKNHGDYVSQGGDPHSCIGMPVQAQS